MSYTKTVCLDFDGVCNLYDGWKGEDELFEPRPHLGDFISTLISSGRKVAIFSTRPPDKLEAWFIRWFPWTLESMHNQDLVFPIRKPPADCYVDDRAVRFNGSFEEVLQQILKFKAHWENKTLEEAILNSNGGDITINKKGEIKS